MGQSTVDAGKNPTKTPLPQTGPSKPGSAAPPPPTSGAPASKPSEPTTFVSDLSALQKAAADAKAKKLAKEEEAKKVAAPAGTTKPVTPTKPAGKPTSSKAISRPFGVSSRSLSRR